MRKSIYSQQNARIVKGWMMKLRVENVSEYSTHSMMKTKPSVIYDKTHNVDAVRRLLGQSSVSYILISWCEGQLILGTS